MLFLGQVTGYAPWWVENAAMESPHADGNTRASSLAVPATYRSFFWELLLPRKQARRVFSPRDLC